MKTQLELFVYRL